MKISVLAIAAAIAIVNVSAADQPVLRSEATSAEAVPGTMTTPDKMKRSISGAVDLGVDLAGVAALAGAGKKAKAETRTVDEIMHSIHQPYTRSTLRLNLHSQMGPRVWLDVSSN
ncbi:hypothetical protein KXD40_006881 [Peronospora effusa]|nr:hypothetical protein KXD40_006881 [Peronospora effusa]